LIRAGVRPESVARFCPSQLKILLLPTADAGESVLLAPNEAAEFHANRIRQRDRWIEEQLAKRRGHRSEEQRSQPHRGVESLVYIADRLAAVDEQASEPPAASNATIPQCFVETSSETEKLRDAIRHLLSRFDELLTTAQHTGQAIGSQTLARFSEGL
jgi:uncharacterized coiled-coil protein SlyX